MTSTPSMPVTERFLSALETLEQNGSVEPMTEVFAESAQLARLGRPAEQGPDAVRQFWSEYREQFADRVDSTFHRIVETPDLVTLEWVTEGDLSASHPILYAGISVLTIDGDRVTDFRTYYDSAAFLTEPAGKA